MITGFLMLLATGLGWTITGSMLSYMARKGISVVTLLVPQILFSVVLASIFLPDYKALTTGKVTGLLPLAILLIGAGILNSAGILVLQAAMRAGHHGTAWSIGQSALVIPFLTGILTFHEPLPLGRIIGVAAIITSLVAFGLAQEKQHGSSPATASIKTRKGFFLALMAMLIFGIAQTVMSLPSHLQGITDTARLRVPLLYIGHCVVYIAWWWRQPERPKRNVVGIAALCSIVAIASTQMLFLGIDRLAKAEMSSVGFPIAVGCSIICFAIYSALIMRETFSRWHAIGLTAALGGIIGIVLSG